jgi:hypothetical protein
MHYCQHSPYVLLVVALVAIAGDRAWSAGLDDVPKTYRADVTCMVDALKHTSLVDQIEVGTFNSDGWSRPFVQYRFSELDGRIGTVRFVGDRSNIAESATQYVARLNGLFTLGGPMPPDLGTREISELWKMKCGIAAVAVYV